MPGVVTAECLVHNISYMYVESMGTSQGRYGMLFHILDHPDRASLFEFGHHKCSCHLSSRSLKESRCTSRFDNSGIYSPGHEPL